MLETKGRTVRQVIPEVAQTLEPLLGRIMETGEPVIDIDIHGTTLAAPKVERDWVCSYFPSSCMAWCEEL